MAYQLLELSLQNVKRRITNTDPLYLPLGGISPNDVTTLIVSVVAGVVVGTATLSLQESVDGGATWQTVTGTQTSGTINAPGTYSLRVTEFCGIVAPNLRLVLTPAAGGSVYLSKAFRTLSTGNNIIPRSAINLSGSGLATESKQDDILAAMNTLLGRVSGSLVPTQYDTILYVSGATTDEYTYAYQGATVKTIIITYTDGTKETLVSVQAI